MSLVFIVLMVAIVCIWTVGAFVEDFAWDRTLDAEFDHEEKARESERLAKDIKRLERECGISDD